MTKKHFANLIAQLSCGTHGDLDCCVMCYGGCRAANEVTRTSERVKTILLRNLSQDEISALAIKVTGIDAGADTFGWACSKLGDFVDALSEVLKVES